jgi:uncharacterized protein involved in outer membrane biogenesis
MATIGKITLAFLVVVLTVLTAGYLYVRHLVDHPDRYLPQAVAYLEQRTGKKIVIQRVQLSVWPILRIRAYGVQVVDPKPFPPGDLLNIPEADLEVRWTPLLRKTLVLSTVTLRQPVINFINDPDGLWNFQDRHTPGQEPQKLALGRIEKLNIVDGRLLGSALIDPQDAPGPVVLDLKDFSATLRHIDFSTFSTGKQTHPIRGEFTAKAARFGVIHTTNLKSHLELTSSTLTFHQFDTRTHAGHAYGDFLIHYAQKKPSFSTSMHVDGIKVDYLLRQFHPGPPQMTGMMGAALDLSGILEHTKNPLSGIHGTGTFAIHQGELPALNKDSKMQQLARFRTPNAKSLPVSAFSVFAGDLQLDSKQIASRRLNLDFYGIVLNGGGRLDELNDGMDYRATATIEKRQGFFMDLFARLFKDAEVKNGRMAFPLKITGTLNHPQVAITD